LTDVAAQSISASIQPLSGVVQRLARGSSTWENITKVTQVRVGDAIRTGSEGSANIVTTLGVQVTVYSNTELDMQELTLGTGAQGKLRASFGLLIGLIYVDISRKLGAGEVVLVSTPSGAAVASGTQFYAAVNKDDDVVIVGQQDTVDYYQIDGTKVSATPNSVAFSKAGAKPVSLSGLDSDVNVTDFKGVLRAIASQFYNVTPNFFASALNASPLPDDAALFKAIENFTPPASISFGTLLEQLRTDLRKYGAGLLSTARGDVTKFSALPLAAPIAPATCGNGKKDAGETQANCPDDFYVFVATNPPSCKPLTGASLINTPAGYCLYSVTFTVRRTLVLGNLRIIITILIRLLIIIIPSPPPPNVRTATFTPVPTSTNPPPPPPSNTPVNPTSTSTSTVTATATSTNTPTATATATSTIRPSGLGQP
jgi:hypothetical protein